MSCWLIREKLKRSENFTSDRKKLTALDGEAIAGCGEEISLLKTSRIYSVKKRQKNNTRARVAQIATKMFTSFIGGLKVSQICLKKASLHLKISFKVSEGKRGLSLPKLMASLVSLPTPSPAMSRLPTTPPSRRRGHGARCRWTR